MTRKRAKRQARRSDRNASDGEAHPIGAPPSRPAGDIASQEAGGADATGAPGQAGRAEQPKERPWGEKEQPCGEVERQDESGAAPPWIVGIGASAGGLEAIERFFDHMPRDSGLAFVVVQHLSPDFKSLMNELLARHTDIAIHQVEDGMRVEPNVIYLIPPKKNMVLSEGRLLLADQDHEGGLNLPIDLFFRSLAHDQGHRAIGVILSGTGSDGSRGVRDLHEAGGLVVVQDQESAAFDGMPRAALATGLVDLVLPPERMPEAIVQYAEGSPPALAEPPPAAETPDELSLIFALLRKEFGIDFAYYKPGTMHRRIERRMTLRGVGSLGQYRRRLSESDAELKALCKDLLVEVTQFFRDPEAFERLRDKVIPRVCEQAGEEGIRVWVAGCATGEEAYTLAMLFREHLDKTKRPLDIKIFATDVHRPSLDVASHGCYSAQALRDLPEGFRERYFVQREQDYVVSQPLRQMVIFAPHNLTKDPPFTKLDMILCRNVLIYFNPAVQKKILTLFHFGLRTGGVLFLGPSENLAELGEEFEVIESRWKLFRKRRDVRLVSTARHPASFVIPEKAAPGGQREARGARPLDAKQRIYELLISRFVGPGFLLDEQRELVHVFGDAGRFLRIPSGVATRNVLKMVDEGLRIALASALHRIDQDETHVVYHSIRATLEGREVRVRLTVDRLSPEGNASLADPGTKLHFVRLEEEPEAPETMPSTPTSPGDTFDLESEAGDHIRSLEGELTYAREHLQTTVEELETSNEELQSTNEELVASNEELQSTNEELHSVNEELFTVNAEYQRKIDELTQLTNDMDNLLRSTDIGTVFLDHDLKIRKFTPAAAGIFNLLPQDIGRPLQHISSNVPMQRETLLPLIQNILQSGELVEQTLDGFEGEAYLMRGLPYRTEHDRIEGVVLTFTDITALRRSQERLDEAVRRRDHFLAILSHELRNPLAAIVNACQVMQAGETSAQENREACRVISRQSDHMTRLLDDLLDVARINENKIQLRLEPIELTEAMREALRSVASQAEKAQLRVRMAIPEQPVWIRGDAVRIQQVQVNLLHNAIKYTPPGGEIEYSLRSDGPQAEIRVRDSGVGMSSQLQQSVFELFVQSDQTLDRSAGGLGLGLTLVKTLVDLHGGEVTAFSEGRGRGSEFTVRLPAVPPPEGRENAATLAASPPLAPSTATHRFRPVEGSRDAEASEDGAPHHDGRPIPRRVLVVEDNQDSRRMMETLLQLDGYHVTTAEDGPGGLQAILEQRPDVAFVDIGLPGFDGYRVAREAREQWEREAPLCLVALTGYGRQEDRQAVLEAGFDHHLVKPIRSHELAEILQNLPGRPIPAEGEAAASERDGSARQGGSE